MVKSILNSNINYIENRKLYNEDKSYDAPLFEYELDNGKTIIIAVGQAKYNYIEDDVIFFPIYYIKNDKVDHQIGLYEIESDEIENMLDSDGDIDISNMGEPLLYSFFDMDNIKDSNNLEDNEEKDKKEDKHEDKKVDENENKKDDKEKDSESDSESDIDDIGTGEFYNVIDKDNWINKYMKSSEYGMVDNEGNGDCLFLSIRDGLKTVGKNVEVYEMRKMLSEMATKEDFDAYMENFKFIDNNLKLTIEHIGQLKDENKNLQSILNSNVDRVQKNKVIEMGKKLSDKHFQLKNDYLLHKELMNDFSFMRKIKTLDDFKKVLLTRTFWGNSWAISLLEKKLNVKFILLSEELYEENNTVNVVHCGDMVDKEIEKKRVFNPDYYIILSYTGLHYKLITYKNIGAIKFNELDKKLVKYISEKCLEKNSGIYSFIPEFKKHSDKGNDMISRGENLLDINDDLFDDTVVLQFYSKSSDKPLPGKGSGEKMPLDKFKDYSELARIPKWRKKLSNFWMEQFELNGLNWMSVEHYYQGSKFKVNNIKFYNEFSVESDSEISKDPVLAKAAGGKSGIYKKERVRPKNIELDPHFFNGEHKISMFDAMKAKFSQNNDLKDMLLATKNAKLVHFSRGSPPVVFYNLMKVRELLKKTHNEKNN